MTHYPSKASGQALRGFLGLLFAVVLTISFAPSSAQAWRSKSSASSNGIKIKKLSKSHRKRIAGQLIRRMLRHEFFKDLDLPHRIALSTLKTSGEAVNMTKREFTDLILNEILNFPGILIVNQDLRIDLSLNYQLVEYLNVINTRKQGIMMGAEYYISGDIESKLHTSESGKQKQNFVASLELREIRSNKHILTVTYDQIKDKGKKKRRRRKGE